MNRNWKFVLCLAGLCSVWVAGCAPVRAVPTLTRQTQATEIVTRIASTTANPKPETATLTPIDIPTSTATVTLPTLTSTTMVEISPTVTLTPHPIRNLTQMELIQQFDFLADKPGCRFPCWNGLTPGVSTAGEVQGFYARLGFDTSSSPPFTSDEVLYNYSIAFGAVDEVQVTVFWENGIVSKIFIWGWKRMALFPPNRIGAVLGPPDQIKLGIYGEKSDYSVNYIYDELHLLLSVYGYGHYDPHKKPTTEICVWDTVGQHLDATWYAQPLTEEILAPLDRFWDWPELLGVTVQGLFDMLTKPNACVPFPVE